MEGHERKKGRLVQRENQNLGEKIRQLVQRKNKKKQDPRKKKGHIKNKMYNVNLTIISIFHFFP